jgi:hypothetical protein
MKILSWNCRGISRPTIGHGLRALIKTNSPDVLFLSETKSPPSLVTSILNRLGFYLMTLVAPTGTSGVLVLAWRLGVELESFLSNQNNISAWCFFDPPQIVPGFCPVFMALLILLSSQPSGTLSLLLVGILLVLGFVLVILTLFLTNLKN